MISKILLASFFLPLVFGLAACARPEQVNKEESLQSIQAGNPPVVELGPQTDLPPPTVDEVRNAIERNFQQAVSFGPDGKREFFTGDFNGDGSQDIVVLVNPVKEKLPDINSSVANWMIADPVALATHANGMGAPKDAEAARVSSKPSVTEQDGSLLAVIHGYGLQGWRDPEARQVYLLKNAAGDQLRAARKSEMAQTGAKDGPFPYLYGDVIRERLAGEPGFIYFSGAGYEWFTPRLYKKEPAKRLIH